jgi:hypothetical protein
MLNPRKTNESQYQAGFWRETKLPAYLKGRITERSGTIPLVGLVSQASQDGRWLVYTGLDMSRSLEFAEADIVDFEQFDPEHSPFGRLGGTRVLLRSNAEIKTSRLGDVREADEFDLDIRMAEKEKSSDAIDDEPETWEAECQGDGGTDGCTDGCTVGCPHRTDNTCKTDCGATCDDAHTCVTCHTCQTKCDQNTCNQQTCNTCNTNCNQQTCETCATNCHQQTCATCNQATCHTCQTKCGGETCRACTHVTCGHQPGCIPV